MPTWKHKQGYIFINIEIYTKMYLIMPCLFIKKPIRNRWENEDYLILSAFQIIILLSWEKVRNLLQKSLLLNKE